MTDWYSFTPQDTLFFRGAEPAVMGESHSASMIFPPPAHTIVGALRTAALFQNEIAFADYNKGSLPPGKESVIEAIGKSGEAAPFNVLGPFFLSEDKIWVPCPFIWFSDKNGKRDPAAKTRKVTISAPCPKTLFKTESGEKLFWAKGYGLETLGGNWVSLDELCTAAEEKTIKGGSDFFTSEIHTGIALDIKNKRKARDGHLYSFVHARLRQDVKLVFGVDRQLPLRDSGIFKLGAEQRFGEYRKIGNIKMPRGSSGLFISLSIVAGSKEANDCCIATGRIQYYGGWDLHKGFHKPMKGYFPAGSVFDKEIDNKNCIQL